MGDEKQQGFSSGVWAGLAPKPLLAQTATSLQSLAAAAVLALARAGVVVMARRHRCRCRGRRGRRGRCLRSQRIPHRLIAIL